jgi:mono/diheme cytochrome c family protein
MRSRFAIFPSLLLVLVATAAHAAAVLPAPPPELARWYKPQNERQVWLHNMFQLRRTLQAVEMYLETGDRQRALAWAERFREHYGAVAEMVPAWSEEIDGEAVERLVAALGPAGTGSAGHELRRIRLTCKSCHGDYRAVVAALYRAPDYGSITVAGEGEEASQTLAEAMESLSHEVNGVLIALQDERPAAGAGHAAALERGLERIRPSCASCHRDAPPVERILGAATEEALRMLREAIAAGDQRAAGRQVAEVAVTVCARCHGVHRTLGDLRRVIDAALE